MTTKPPPGASTACTRQGSGNKAQSVKPSPETEGLRHQGHSFHAPTVHVNGTTDQRRVSRHDEPLFRLPRQVPTAPEPLDGKEPRAHEQAHPRAVLFLSAPVGFSYVPLRWPMEPLICIGLACSIWTVGLTPAAP